MSNHEIIKDKDGELFVIPDIPVVAMVWEDPDNPLVEFRLTVKYSSENTVKGKAVYYRVWTYECSHQTVVDSMGVVKWNEVKVEVAVIKPLINHILFTEGFSRTVLNRWPDE